MSLLVCDSVRDPFTDLLGQTRGANVDGDTVTGSDTTEYVEPTVELLAAKGDAVIGHFAPAYIGRELHANDEEFDTAAGDLIANIVHAVAHRYGMDRAAQLLGGALTDVVCERHMYAPNADGSEPGADAVEPYADTAYDTAIRRAG